MRPRRHWFLFVTLLLAEFVYFDRMVSRHHAWIYPRWNDQIQYLTEAYTGYEYLRTHGFLSGLWQTLINPSAQGTLHDCFAVLIFCLTGPSRSAALSINLLAFLAWQLAAVLVWRRLFGRWSGAWLGAGLLLCLHVLIDTGPGSPVDFRLDWLACSAVGVALSIGLLTDGFKHTGWSALFGVAVGLAILVRFLTVVYFGTILGVLLVVLGGGWIIRRPAGWGGRLGRLGLAGALAASVCLPLLWQNRDWVINYYWIGHLTGPESALRSPNFGLGRSVEFILKEALWSHHLGAAFVWAATGAMAALGLAAWLGRGQPAQDSAPSYRAGPAAWLGALAFGIPAAVLILHSQKSPYVVSVLLPGLMALLLAILAPLARRAATASTWPKSIPTVVAAGILLTGLVNFGHGYARTPNTEEFVASAHEVNALADYLFETSRAAGLTAPKLAVDQVTDSLDAQIMRVICYERQKVWWPFMMTLPTGITEEKESVLWDRLKESDFVLLTIEMGGEGFWPYDHQMRRLHPQFFAWCEQHLRHVKTFPLSGRTMRLYERAPLKRD